MTEVTPEQYGELCDLFAQAFVADQNDDWVPDLTPDRMMFTGPQARAFANAVVHVLGLTMPVPSDEDLRRIVDYLNRGDPNSKD